MAKTPAPSKTTTPSQTSTTSKPATPAQSSTPTSQTANVRQKMEQVRQASGGTVGGTVSKGASVKGQTKGQIMTFTSKSGKAANVEIKQGESPEQAMARYEASAKPAPITKSGASEVKLTGQGLFQFATQRGAALGKGTLEGFKETPTGQVVARYTHGEYIFPQQYATQGISSQTVIKDRYGNRIDITGKSPVEVQKAIEERESNLGFDKPQFKTIQVESKEGTKVYSSDEFNKMYSGEFQKRVEATQAKVYEKKIKTGKPFSESELYGYMRKTIGEIQSKLYKPKAGEQLNTSGVIMLTNEEGISRPVVSYGIVSGKDADKARLYSEYFGRVSHHDINKMQYTRGGAKEDNRILETMGDFLKYSGKRVIDKKEEIKSYERDYYSGMSVSPYNIKYGATLSATKSFKMEGISSFLNYLTMQGNEANNIREDKIAKTLLEVGIMYKDIIGEPVGKLYTGATKLLEGAGQGLGYGLVVSQKSIRPLQVSTAFAIDPRKAASIYSTENIKESFETPYEILTKTAQQDFTEAGIYYRSGVDIASWFVMPSRPMIEFLRTPSKELISNPIESAFLLGSGAAYSFFPVYAESKALKFTATEAYQSLKRPAPIKALGDYNIKSFLSERVVKPMIPFFVEKVGWLADKGFRYGLPSMFVGQEAYKLYTIPTPEGKRQEMESFNKQMLFITLGAKAGIRYADYRGYTGTVLREKAKQAGMFGESKLIGKREFTAKEFAKVRGYETPELASKELQILQEYGLISGKKGTKLEIETKSYNELDVIIKSMKPQKQKGISDYLKEWKTSEPKTTDTLKSLLSRDKDLLFSLNIKESPEMKYSFTDKGFKNYRESQQAFEDFFGVSKKGGKLGILDEPISAKPSLERVEILPKPSEGHKGEGVVSRSAADILGRVMQEEGLILGGSAGMGSYFTSARFEELGFKAPSDVDIFLPKKYGLLTGLKLKSVGGKVTARLEDFGYKPERIESDSMSYKIFFKEGKAIEIHAKELAMAMPTGGLITTRAKGDIFTNPLYKLSKTTSEGIRVLRSDIQARNLLMGAYYNIRAAKDYPRFMKLTRGMYESTTTQKEYASFLETKNLYSEFNIRMMKIALKGRGELSEWKSLKTDFLRTPQRKIDVLKGIKQDRWSLDYTFGKTPSNILSEFVTSGNRNAIYKKEYGAYVSSKSVLGYKPEEYKSKPYADYKAYKIYASYVPYTNYKSYRQYELTKPYPSYKAYVNYAPYTPYTPYTPYKPYVPYVPYTPYKPYTPYSQYNQYKPYQPYRPYVPYKPIDEIIIPPEGKPNKKKEKKKKSKGNVKQRYLPSLVAIGERIYGKPNKVLTGLEIRPIDTRRL